MASDDGRATHVLCLCPEILAHIFKHLELQDKKHVALVCVAWCRAVYQPLLWRDVTVVLNVRRPNEGMLQSLKNRDIRHVKALDEWSLVGVTRHLPQLESLRCSTTVKHMTLYRAFSRRHHHLTTLSLSWCKHVVDENLLLIAMNAPHLTSLDLTMCKQLTDSALLEIARLKKLTDLKLAHCAKISDEGIWHISFLPLVNLELRCCDRLTDVALSLIGTGIPTLERLSMAFCIKVSGSGLKFFKQGKESKIEFLDLTECRLLDIEMQYLSGMWRLKELELNDCDRIGDDTMRYLSSLPNLRTLYLSQGFVGDEGLCHLAYGGSKLEVLTILQCGLITDVGCRHLSVLKNLSFLWLTSYGDITDLGMSLLCHPDSKLTHLDVGGQYWLRDSSFSYLARMKRLQRLDVATASDFTDEGLALLAEGGSKIVDLDLGYCEQITDAGLTHLLKLPNLKTVRVVDCAVTSMGVNLLTDKGIIVRGLSGDLFDS